MNLTKAHKEAMATKAVEDALAPHLAKLEKDLTSFADDLYLQTCGKDAPIADKLPPNWLPRDDKLSINCSGFCYGRRKGRPYGQYGKLHSEIKMSKERVLPSNGHPDFRIEEGHKFWKRSQGLVTQAGRLVEMEEEIRSTMMAFLSPFRTFAKLKAEWPEGEKYFPQEAKPSLPPVDHKLAIKINKTLGIKPGVQA